VETFLTEVEQSQRRLWEIAVANALKDMNSDISALYIESLNEVFKTHAIRIAKGFQEHIPIGIWIMLITLTCLGMAGVGYQTGIADLKRSLVRLILALSFALVIALIADLDRPGGGYIRVTHQPLIDLHSWISENSNLIKQEN